MPVDCIQECRVYVCETLQFQLIL